MDTDSTILITFMIILTACSAFFSATETAYLSLNQTKIKITSQGGDKRALIVLGLCNDYDRLISTILIGNNIVNLTLSSISTVLFIKYFAGLGATLSTIVITFIVLLFGEITPKTIARERSEHFALKTAYLIKTIVILLYPLSVVFGLWQKMINSFSRKPAENAATEEEIITMVDEAEDVGNIDEDEGDLIRSAIEFNDTTAEEILTPRSDVIYINEEMTDEEIVDMFIASGYSRLPFCGKSLDDLHGVLHEKDLLAYLRNHERPLSSYLTKPVFVSKHIGIFELLKNMQNTKCHMAIVSDEFGALSGIVTLEDIVEELIGEVWDEHDKVEDDFTPIDTGSLIVNCSAELDDLLEHFGIEETNGESKEQAQTVNGWLIKCFGDIPCVGESLDIDGFHVEIVSVDQTKILKARITKLEPDE